MQRDDTRQIKLEPARQFPACRSSSDCVSLKDWPSRFWLQRVHGVKVTAQGNDIDYGQRWYLIQTPPGKRGIQTDYRDPEGFLVIDARGQSADGECWRLLGQLGETASYSEVTQDQAGLLDKLLGFRLCAAT